MQYIRPTPNESGAYSAPQSTPFKGCLTLTEDQVNTLISYNGFVILTVENNIVTSIAPNTEAWESWKASLPEPTDPDPTVEDLTLDILVDQEARICMLELAQ